MSKAQVFITCLFFSRIESQLCIYCPSCPPCCCTVDEKFCKKSSKHQKKTTRTTVTAYGLGSSTLAVHDWPLFTLKFGVLSSLLVECIAAAKYSDRRSPTPRPTQRSRPAHPARPARPNPTLNTTPNSASAPSRAKSAPIQAQRAHQCVQSIFF